MVLEFQLGHPNVPLYILGDFNCYLDPSLDKHPPRTGGRALHRTALKKIVEEVGGIDPWRGKYRVNDNSRALLNLIDIITYRFVSLLGYSRPIYLHD